jgi:hypothetical protein
LAIPRAPLANAEVIKTGEVPPSIAQRNSSNA